MRVPFNVLSFLERAALVFPDRTAVVDEPGTPGSLGSVTYAELLAKARGLAAGLDRLGVDPGERVAIVSPNAGKFITSLFGVSGFGRVLVPVNFRLNADEVSYILEHSGASAVLVDPEMQDLVAGTRTKHRILLDGVEDEQLFAGAAGADPRAWTPEDDDATVSVNYTSGTTARPKGVGLTHRNCWLNAVTLGWHTAVTDRDVYLHTLPTFHCNGWGMPYAVSAMGCKQVIVRKIDGAEILRRIDAEGVTLLCAAPAVVAAVLDAAPQFDATPGRDRVRIVVAGAPPPSKTIERVETELGWEFMQLYGLTETAPLVTFNRAPKEWDDLDAAERSQRLSRAGVPAIGVDVRISEDGEILTRSNNVFAGYWDQPDETAKAIPDGWFHTGDGGYFDGPFVTISDRKKDVIITGAENVSSIEVEDALYQHPAVAEACVIGVPDDKWGETVKALVVLRPGSDATERELIDHCRNLLAHYKCPTSVELRDALERTATGKLQKFRMRAPYWEGRERAVN